MNQARINEVHPVRANSVLVVCVIPKPRVFTSGARNLARLADAAFDFVIPLSETDEAAIIG